MKKVMMATVAFAGVLGLAACNNAAEETPTDETAAAADESAADAGSTASGGGSTEAASATDSASDASASGSMSGETATGGGTITPTTTNDPMVTGQGSMREGNPNRGNIDMPSEPAHPARQ